MVDVTKPVYGDVWANTGEKLAPDSAKIATGWIQEMMPYQYENFLQNRADTAITYLLQKGVAEWSSDQEYIANKSVVTYSGQLYMATATTTNVLPTVTASWKKLSVSFGPNGAIPVSFGGTGATTAVDARTNLGIGSAATANLPAGNGMLVKLTDNTLVARSVAGTAGYITVTNGDGVAGNPTINIGANVAKTDADTAWTTTSSIRIPSGSTAQRGTGAPGRIRFNLETGVYEGYDNTGWNPIGSVGALDVQNFQGDGVRTTFTLSSTPRAENNTQVYFNGVYQQKNTYNLVGNDLVFDEAPASDISIEVVNVSSVPIGTTTAAQTSIVDSGNYYSSSNVEGALQQSGGTLSKTILSFPTFTAAEAAAATLPDGQTVEAPDSNGQRISFNVSGGVLAPSGGIRNFRRSAVGAVVLEYQDRISASPINLVEFGAVEGKDFDSTSAFLKAAAAAQTWAALGKKTFIEVPPGDWKLTAKVVLPFGTSLLGGGVIHAHTPQVFEWSGGLKDVCTSVKNIDIVAYVVPPNDGTGFALNFNGLRANRCIVDVRNFNVRSSDGITRTYGFDDYIKVHDLLKVTLSGLWFDCCFKALSGNVLAGQYLQNAVRVTGITTQLMLSDFLFASIYRGVYGTGSYIEGVRISHGDFVGVYYGIDFPEYSRPGIWIDSVHINAVRQAIRISGANTVDISISNVWLYRSHVFFADTDWTAVSIEGAAARTNLSNISTSVSITTDTIYGIKLKGCSGVNAVGLGLSQTNRAIYHEGTNAHVNYDDVVFNGLGVTGVGLTTTATDNNITLGLHKFLGSFGTKYSLGSNNPTVIIDTGRIKYRALGSSSSLSAAATITFTIEESQQLRILNFGAGTGAFNYDVQLDKANARPGDFLDIRLTFAASTNPTCRILNGISGPVLGSVQGSAGSTTRYFARLVYDGGNWIFADCHQSLF